MSRFRFVHAADLHLDTPFEGLARSEPYIAEILRDASLDVWDALVELTLREQAAFLLLAGDIYDGAERGVRAQLRFLAGLERLAARGVETFIVHGNHDPLDGWSAIREWPPGVHVFAGGDVQAIGIEREEARIATVHGVSYLRRATTDNLALRFQRREGPGLAIGLLHCNVGGEREHAPYSPCSLTDLRRAHMDYWALGHIHRRQTLVEGDPWIVYPGNTQGRSPKPSEQGAKGAVVVEVRDQAIESVAFRPLDRMRFVHERHDIAEIADLGALKTTLAALGRRLRDSEPERGWIVRVTLAGRGPVHEDLREPDALAALLAELRAAPAPGGPPLWWESLRDATRVRLDRTLLRRRDDFLGELARLGERLREEPAALERLAASRWAAIESLALPSGSDADDVAQLLDRAEELALDLLAGGDGA